MKELDEDLVLGICEYQAKLQTIHAEYSEFLRVKGYRCEQVGRLVYHIHPDYWDKWVETRSYKGLPSGAAIQY